MSRKLYWFILLSLLFTLALSACGGQNNTETGITPDTPTDSTETNNTGMNDAAATPTTNVSALPLLPGLSQGGAATGIGGGGGEALSADGAPQPLPVDGMGGGDGMDMPIYFENRLENAQFNLNTTLPELPTSAAVSQLTQNELSMEQMRDWANRFGFTGTIYTDPWYDQFIQENPGVYPGPRSYYLFDGARMLSFYGANISYSDNNATPTDGIWTSMPFEQARPIAEAYLSERGLLDFPYEIVPNPYGGDEVAFYRLINGVRQTTSEISAVVAPNGSIFSLYVQPYSAFNAIGDYPLISAADAWQLAQDTPDYQRIIHNIYTDPATISTEASAPPTDYRSWPRIFQNGETVTLYFYPIVYKTVDGSGTPLVKTGDFTLIASDADLLAIAANTNQYIKATGIVQGDMRYNQTLQLNSYEIVGNYQDWQYKQGTIRHADGQTYLDTIEGETFLIPNAPSDLPEGEQVYVNGPSIEADGTFLWYSIEKVIVYSDEPAIFEPGEFPTPTPITQVNIDKVELIYSMSYIPPVDGNDPGSTWLQPAWRFTGTTDTGELVELIVQAVAPQFLQPAG